MEYNYSVNIQKCLSGTRSRGGAGSQHRWLSGWPGCAGDLGGDGRVSLAGTAALEEDTQILKVIEAYCTSAKTRQTLNSSKCRRSPRPLCWLLLPEITPQRMRLWPCAGSGRDP